MTPATEPSPEEIRARQAACLHLVKDRQAWDALCSVANGMLELAAVQNLDELDDTLRPRAYYRGLTDGLRTLLAAISAEAERARTENDPVAKAEDETALVADVIAQFSSGGGRLA